MRDVSRDYLYAVGKYVHASYTPGRRPHASVKIGRSQSPGERLLMLRHEFDGDCLWIVDALPRLALVEPDVHKALEPWRLGGEWFADTILIAVLRWGFAPLVSWALGDVRVPDEMADFLAASKRDAEDVRREAAS
jgi:hypothetical protein